MQNPLKDGQLQLVTASLAKMPGTNADPYPQRFQVLTFFASPPTAPHQLVMERRVLGRLGGVGKYVFLKLADSAQESEAVLLDY
jgi:hypothetical protein